MDRIMEGYNRRGKPIAGGVVGQAAFAGQAFVQLMAKS